MREVDRIEMQRVFEPLENDWVCNLDYYVCNEHWPIEKGLFFIIKVGGDVGNEK